MQDDQSDSSSTFTYEDGGTPHSIDLLQLRRAMAEGGFHKIYDISAGDGRCTEAVVRVAAPAFPRDKMGSEVAALKYIAEYTSLPVPKVYAWNTNGTNPVGAEYMIMEKIPGITPFESWKTTMPFENKRRIVEQVARHMVELFYVRFSQAGSLYLDFNSTFYVGPIVSTPFYHLIDGYTPYPSMSAQTRTILDTLRGPFSKTSEYLSSSLNALLVKVESSCEETLRALNEDEDVGNAELALETAVRAVNKAIELCHLYPGDLIIHGQLTTPEKPFTFKFDDFRLVNLLVDDIGNVHSYIDLEATSIAPVWECATVPTWIPDPDSDMKNWYGGTAEEQRALWDTFHQTIDQYDIEGEWRRAYELGEPFRELCGHLEMGIKPWSWEGTASWIEKRLVWAKGHPGEGMKRTLGG